MEKFSFTDLLNDLDFMVAAYSIVIDPFGDDETDEDLETIAAEW